MCFERNKAYFDGGISLLSDSLHNCYHGATVIKCSQKLTLFTSILEKTFLSSYFWKYRNEPWSCYKNFKKLKIFCLVFIILQQLLVFPDRLVKWMTTKGNEFRFILLFGFIPFENYISVDHCSNLLCLVMAMHLAEMSSIDKSQCNEINEL